MSNEKLEEFILRAGFTYGWKDLESQARRMAEKAVEENEALAARLYEAERQLLALLANTDTAQDLAKAKDDARKFLEGGISDTPTGSDAANRLHQRWLAANKVDSEEWYRIAGIRPEDFENPAGNTTPEQPISFPDKLR